MNTKESFKSGFVTIIGRPNVGKSTLINSMIGEKLTITADKQGTTRNKIHCILTTDEAQIIFLDTPGIMLKAKNKLNSTMKRTAYRTLREVDLIIFVIEPDMKIGQGDRAILEALKNYELPIFLVINKVDKIKNNEILQVIETYKDEVDFAEIIPLSAIRGETEDLVLTITKYLQAGPMYFPENMATDQPERQIAAEFIREKAIRNLKEELPHSIAVEIMRMKERENEKLTRNKPSIIDIDATIYCERDSQKGIIVGKGGELLKKIGTQARQDIEHMLDCKVNLQLYVKAKKDWRNSDTWLKNFGLSIDNN